MFFAAVEIRDRPELKDKPVAVGGMSMISTANYVARQYGVRSAMPVLKLPLDHFTSLLAKYIYL
jgi:nucleotidyltransferase/DNA polymerase involved in DNA repair